MSDCGFSNTFDKIEGFNEYSILAQTEENLKAYLDWGFLNIGGFINCTGLDSNLYGMQDTKAVYYETPQYASGRAWKTLHKPWVHESGISYGGKSPTKVSGVKINTTFYPAPTGSGSVSYKLDYINGQIIFDKPVATGSKVYIDYSYKKCQVYKGSSCNWWGEFKNAIFASDPERQSLDIDSRIQILKSINLDDVRKFFKENYIFDENLKILLNDVAVDSGLNSNAVTDTLMQLNPNKIKAQEPYEYKVLEIPSSQKILMSSNLDKSSASITIGNLTEDLKGLSKEDRILLTLSLNALHRGMTSRLGARLREKGIYHWGLDFQLPSENLGKVTVPQKPFSINCHCNPSQVDEIKQVISTTLKEYLADGPKPEELAQAQHGLIESVADGSKSIQGRYNFFRVIPLCLVVFDNVRIKWGLR